MWCSGCIVTGRWCRIVCTVDVERTWNAACATTSTLLKVWRRSATVAMRTRSVERTTWPMTACVNSTPPSTSKTRTLESLATVPATRVDRLAVVYSSFQLLSVFTALTSVWNYVSNRRNRKLCCYRDCSETVQFVAFILLCLKPASPDDVMWRHDNKNCCGQLNTVSVRHC